MQSAAARLNALPRFVASPLFALALAVGFIAVSLQMVSAEPLAQESWLDSAGAPTGWNQPGQAVPLAAERRNLDPRCGVSARWAETAEDQALADAGWSLFAPYQAGWGVSVVDAASDYDGMCRPLGYQAFVFADGAFAGTISPMPMDSRTTGAGFVVGFRGDTVTARFLRYAPTDPLCCPSRGAVLIEFAVERTPDGPVLVPTRRTEEPAPGPSR